MWDRNFQLAFWSASIYLPILVYDNPTNPFIGWSSVAVACSAVGALGGTHPPPRPWAAAHPEHEAATSYAKAATSSRAAGVLVALSIKYTDSILKTIATTGSIAPA